MLEMNSIVWLILFSLFTIAFLLVMTERSRNFTGSRFKWFDPPPQAELTHNLEGYRVIVTGGNTGIGKDTVSALLGMGADVIVGGRSVQRCYDAFSSNIDARSREIAALRGPHAKPGKFSAIQLDLGSFASIKSFASQITDPINILVNNAGVAGIESVQLTQDGLGGIMGVNHFGVYLLTRLLIPNLIAGAERSSIPSRVVVVASEAHQFSDHFKFDNLDRKGDVNSTRSSLIVYSQSKLANIFFTRELAARCKEKNLPITVNCLHPGFVRTDLAREATGILRLAYDFFSTLQAMSSWDGAQNSIHLAASPLVATVNGGYFANLMLVEPDLGPYPEIIQKLLWDASAEKTHLSPDF